MAIFLYYLHVMIEQDTSDPTHSVGCSPMDHPTAEYIAANAAFYADWSQLQPRWYVWLEELVRVLVVSGVANRGDGHF